MSQPTDMMLQRSIMRTEVLYKLMLKLSRLVARSFALKFCASITACTILAVDAAGTIFAVDAVITALQRLRASDDAGSI